MSEKYIKFTKLILKNEESLEKKQSSNFKHNDELNYNNEEKIILLYPISGKIITESKYKEINNLNNTKIKKKTFLFLIK